MKLTLDKLKIKDVVRNIKSGKRWEVIRDYRYKNEGFEVMTVDGTGRTMMLTEKNIGRYELIFCNDWLFSRHRKDAEKFKEVVCIGLGCSNVDVCKIMDYISEVFDEL